MSEVSDSAAARQLFMLAVNRMAHDNRSLHDVYGYFCLESHQKNVQILHGTDKAKFLEDCAQALKFDRRKRVYQLNMSNAPSAIHEHLMRMFCGGYNTLYESALCWLEPMEDALYDALDDLEEDYDELKEEYDELKKWAIDIEAKEIVENYEVNYLMEQAEKQPKSG